MLDDSPISPPSDDQEAAAVSGPPTAADPPQQGDTAMPDTLPINPLSDDQGMLAEVIDYYQRTLKETTEGLAYLRKRGITHAEIIDHFRIGYSNRTLGLKLPTKMVKEGKRIRWKLERIGVYRGTGREHLRGCMTFPIPAADGSGRIVDIYGRKTLRQSRHAPLHMHIARQPCGVWNVEALRTSKEIILCSVTLRCVDVLASRLSQCQLHVRAGRCSRRIT